MAGGKMRIFVASLSTETNTFTPMPTTRNDFRIYNPGPGSEGKNKPHPAYTILHRRAPKDGIVVLEGLGASAPPSGTVRQDTYEEFRDEILQQVTAAMPLDGVVLGLHGAMVAHGYDDVEGDLLSKVRAIVGPDCPIGAELDPHSHLTDLRFDSADILIAFKEFPHIDVIERAEEVVDLTIRMIRKEIKPVMAKFDCRMIEVLPTSTQPMRGFADRMMALEAHSELSGLSDIKSHIPGDPEILSVSCIHGFMAADVECMGSAMLVITDNQPEKGAELAQKLGMELFELRGTTRPEYLHPQAGIDRAVAADKTPNRGFKGKKMPAVIADVWDNPGGGAPGDGTVILEMLIEQRIKGVGYASVWDPQAISLCRAAGEGGQLQLRFGGKTHHLSGQPIDALVEVVSLVDNATFSSNNGNLRSSLGPCALVRINYPEEDGGGSIHVVLSTSRNQVVNPDVWNSFGIDPFTFDILVVKSTNHFFGGFGPIASVICYVDTGLKDGLTPYPNDPSQTAYTKLSRPIWPREADPHRIGSKAVPWNAEVEELVEAVARL